MKKLNLNETVSMYLDLKNQIKDLKKTQDELTNILKSEASKRSNSFKTKDFDVILQLVEYERLASLKEVEKIIPREKLVHCINIVESKKLIVNKK